MEGIMYTWVTASSAIRFIQVLGRSRLDRWMEAPAERNPMTMFRFPVKARDPCTKSPEVGPTSKIVFWREKKSDQLSSRRKRTFGRPLLPEVRTPKSSAPPPWAPRSRI